MLKDLEFDCKASIKLIDIIIISNQDFYSIQNLHKLQIQLVFRIYQALDSNLFSKNRFETFSIDRMVVFLYLFDVKEYILLES
jgi:hypothetical protein